VPSARVSRACVPRAASPFEAVFRSMPRLKTHLVATTLLFTLLSVIVQGASFCCGRHGPRRAACGEEGRQLRAQQEAARRAAATPSDHAAAATKKAQQRTKVSLEQRAKRQARDAQFHALKRAMARGQVLSPSSTPKRPATVHDEVDEEDASFDDVLHGLDAEEPDDVQIQDNVSADGDIAFRDMDPDSPFCDLDANVSTVSEEPSMDGRACGEGRRPHGAAAKPRTPTKRDLKKRKLEKTRRVVPPPCAGDRLTAAQRMTARARDTLRPGPSLVMDRLRRRSPMRAPLPRGHPPLASVCACTAVATGERPRSTSSTTPSHCDTSDTCSSDGCSDGSTAGALRMCTLCCRSLGACCQDT